MIVDYRHNARSSRLFAVLDAATGQEMECYYADDRIGLVRRYRRDPSARPDGPLILDRGPDGNLAEEEVRRPIRIAVRDTVTDPADRAFAGHLLETFRDRVSPDWPEGRLADFEGLMIGLTEEAIGRGMVGMEAIDEVRSFVDRFRRMREELQSIEIRERRRADPARRAFPIVPPDRDPEGRD